MKKVLIATMALGLAASFGTAVAGDAAAGKGKYAVCGGCHGPTGAGNAALNYPKLAGHDAAYIAKALNDYKSGARANATMKAMTGGLSDADIANLAAYISSF